MTQPSADSLVVVESREAALAPVPAGSNDLLQPIERGLIDADHVDAEIGELVQGTQARPNHVGPDHALQVGWRRGPGWRRCGLVVRAACERGVGREVEV